MRDYSWLTHKVQFYQTKTPRSLQDMESIRLPGSYYGSDDLGEHSQPGDREKLIVVYTIHLYNPRFFFCI